VFQPALKLKVAVGLEALEENKSLSWENLSDLFFPLQPEAVENPHLKMVAAWSAQESTKVAAWQFEAEVVTPPQATFDFRRA